MCACVSAEYKLHVGLYIIHMNKRHERVSVHITYMYNVRISASYTYTCTCILQPRCVMCGACVHMYNVCGE